ncbi:hypothetical protein QTP88_027580 [Uroleucon formosanum]
MTYKNRRKDVKIPSDEPKNIGQTFPGRRSFPGTRTSPPGPAFRRVTAVAETPLKYIILQWTVSSTASRRTHITTERLLFDPETRRCLPPPLCCTPLYVDGNHFIRDTRLAKRRTKKTTGTRREKIICIRSDDRRHNDLASVHRTQVQFADSAGQRWNSRHFDAKEKFEESKNVH